MTGNTQNDRSKGTLAFLAEGLKRNFMQKSAGFYVGAAAWLLTFIHTIVYSSVPGEIFSTGVIAAGVVGIILFPALSLFKRTSSLAPVALMVCDFMCLMCAAGADGIIDYLSTQFFDGFSLAKIFALPFPVWFSVLSFVVSFIAASVAIYLPQYKKEKPAEGENV